jgi:hypothetical protein
VLTELKNRGVEDACMVVCDGLSARLETGAVDGLAVRRVSMT